jgi:hypothetical protein
MQFEVFCIYGGEGEFCSIKGVISEDYHWFFKLQAHANRFSAIVEIAGLFTPKMGTVNFHRLAQEVWNEGSIDLAERDRLAAVLRTRPRVVEGVRRIRNRALSHRDAAMDFNDVFKTANVTPNEVRALTDDGLEVSSALCSARHRMHVTFNVDDLRRDAKRLFEALGASFPNASEEG